MFDSKSLDIQWVKGQIAADIGKEGCLFKFFMHIVLKYNMYMWLLAKISHAPNPTFWNICDV